MPQLALVPLLGLCFGLCQSRGLRPKHLMPGREEGANQFQVAISVFPNPLASRAGVRKSEPNACAADQTIPLFKRAHRRPCVLGAARAKESGQYGERGHRKLWTATPHMFNKVWVTKVVPLLGELHFRVKVNW